MAELCNKGYRHQEKTSFNSVKAKGIGHHPGVQLATGVPKPETVPLSLGVCEQQTLKDKQHETDFHQIGI